MNSLYNFSPLANLMLMGIVLALGPLVWVGWRNRRATPSARFQALTVLTLFLTFDLVMFGAFTRLTDSGLGCPDWPGCYGHASPVGAKSLIAAAQSALPSGPVTQGKAWIEMIHRYLATGVGVLILVLAVSSWLAKARGGKSRLLSPGWPTLTLFWVCLQGAFGAWTVTMKLFPAIVTLHLLGGVTLLALLTVQVMRSAQAQGATALIPVSPALRKLLWGALALLALQVLLGGWVSTNYAVLACSDFPKCQNSWWPDMNFSQGFQFWRELGLTASGEAISFAALTAIHYVHRSMALVVLVVFGLLAWRLNRLPALRAHSRWLAGLISLQLVTGLSNVVLGWPLSAAVLHTGGAGALVIVMTWTLASSRATAADLTWAPEAPNSFVSRRPA